MQKILLIAPNFNPEDSVGGKARYAALYGHNRERFPAAADMLPLGLATVAALTPDEIELDIWYEGVDGQVDDTTDLKKDYDLVGVTGYSTHTSRVRELGQIFRRRGIPVAVGGPGVSSAPEVYRDYFDILFIGEAEYTWPRFITDWEAGNYRSEYRQVTKVDMADSPLPKWDRVADAITSYQYGAVQTTRGCPFDCEFCDVIYIYGRQARNKAISQVLEEISALERLGMPRIFLCDDNFIGNPRYGKALLKELIPLNSTFRRPVKFYTQITLNVAKDEEFLELLFAANFSGLFIGIETPNIESLIETNKPQNYKTDIVADVKKIQSYGLPIRAGLIVGFDHDDTSIFDLQFEFLQESCIAAPVINLLYAPIGTKLWVRLHKEGRVLDFSSGDVLMSIRTNIMPKQMTRVELLSGYRDLLKRVRDWRNFHARIKGMIEDVRQGPLIQQRLLPSVQQQRPFWRRELGIIKFCLSMGWKGGWSALRLLWFAQHTAPFMLNKVRAQIREQRRHALRMPMVLSAIEEEIRQELAGEITLVPEQTVFFVPEAFRKPYKEIFPMLYERVNQGLTDKSRTDSALAEVIYDFLTRWGLTFEQFEEHHHTFLMEICDRTIANENGNNHLNVSKGPVALGNVPDPIAGLTEGQVAIRLKKLADEILQAVEQDMRGFRSQPPDSELKPVEVG